MRIVDITLEDEEGNVVSLRNRGSFSTLIACSPGRSDQIEMSPAIGETLAKGMALVGAQQGNAKK
jgi:hypothetical protein